MTPKEKAEDLIEKYRDENHHFEKDTIEWAIHFSVICVDEIIKSYPTYVKTFNSSKGLHVIHEDNRKYWESVKLELSLL